VKQTKPKQLIQQTIPKYFKQQNRQKQKRRQKPKLNPDGTVRRPRQRQTMLTGLVERHPEQRAGDTFQTKKPPQHIRLMSNNYNNLPAEAYKHKGRQYLEAIKYYQTDVEAGQEHGLNMPMLAGEDSLEERMADISDGRVTTAYNVWDKRIEKHLYGGTMITTTKEATHRTISTSVDPTKMGRWASVLLAGKKGFKTRIVSVYNPIGTSTGSRSVNAQQQRQLRTLGDTRTPRKALVEDLKHAVKRWTDDKEHLVICMDANEDVRNGDLTKMLRDQGLHNPILTKHPHLASIATYERSEQNFPIDAIMTTLDTTDQVKCGYLAFQDGPPGDHRTLWMDIPFELIFGNNPPHMQGVKATPVAVQDPRIRKKFNKRVMNKYVEYGILEKARLLRSQMNRGEAIALIKPRLEALIQITTQIRKEAAIKVRRLKTGNIPWSPHIQAIKNLQRLWA
jgi:hypothetical protein